ncbi:retropepsin-like aspartic protease [Parabacteroides distasonis]|uniref:Aspartyl protease n=1 Tax=Parabacteroides distasonis TaxID=823 RepID=A0A4S2F4F3_PARDI|nr:retropepsin-like aspartic protease [Parabacteroides distasonis]TGY63856.1 hypothetical protein E5342_00435 [Parabacteroides distasonis]
MKTVLYALMIVFLLSCTQEKKRPVYYSDDTNLEYQDITLSDKEISIPFREENGVKYIQVEVNGMPLEMIFDTGCSSTLLSLAEANYLYQKGKLAKEDLLGISKSQIADGSIVENMVVNLKEIVIDDQIVCPNVTATVSNNLNAPLLLGNEILNRLATITIDNDNNKLKFKLK